VIHYSSVFLVRIGFACYLLFLHSFSIVGQQSISEVRLLPPGSVVTTTGTVTSGAEFGQIRYIQDAHAGIAIYDEDLSSTLAGDSIIVTGVLSAYRGEMQLSPVFSFQLIQSGKITAPLNHSDFQEISVQVFESRKMIIPCAGINSCEAELAAGWYDIFDQFGNKTRLWIAEDHPVTGFPILDRPVSIEGIWTKFEDQYQLLCQKITDASEGSCHYISPPHLAFIQDAPSIYWNQIPYALTYVEIQGEDFDLSIDFGLHGLNAEVAPENLIPGRIYSAQLFQQDSFGTVYGSIPLRFSPPTPVSPIEVLFNRSIDASFSDGSTPLGTGSSVIETDLIQRIDNVTSTLDIAMYNTGRFSVVQALTRAVQRGVNVRFIADDETSNTALEGQLSFPIFYRSGSGIMHNKFVIGDADIPDLAWLWTGSTNLTSNQLSTDPNHAYIIHDQALARSYKLEFDEMWGELPDRSDARYGDFKTNNTVHLFKTGETLIESYFSPSDETNCHLIDALRTTDHQVLIGLLLLTYEELVDVIIDLHQQGKEVRVILEDEENSMDAFARLTAAGVNMVTHDPSPIFHHKYAIIDEGYLDSDPQVITGSHNWTWSADNTNDENTLIIHDQTVTNIFRQEFEARWKELNPTSVNQISDAQIYIYPNPASDAIHVVNPTPATFEIELLNVGGNCIFKSSIGRDENKEILMSENIPSGVYLLRFTSANQRFTNQLIILK
jgi:hypothetical protein